MGVARRQKRPPSPASMPISPSGVSARRNDVTSTQRGPRACSAPTAALASSSVATSRPVSHSSSNWLGVRMSAAGSAASRRNSGMPGRTKTPRPTSPITGSQHHSAAGFAAFTRRAASRIASPISADPM